MALRVGALRAGAYAELLLRLPAPDGNPMRPFVEELQR